MEIERESLGSSQNERNLGGGGLRKGTRTNKAEEGGRQNSGILSECTFGISPIRVYCCKSGYTQRTSQKQE